MDITSLLYQLPVAFLATAAFAVLFHVPAREYGFAGLTGAVGWLVYLLVLAVNPSVVLASLAASMALTALSRVFAVRRRTPITIFLICGIFPLVPGTGIYDTVYYFIMGRNDLALDKGVQTVKIAVAIALGIVLMLSLPYSVFRRFHRGAVRR